jgi:hypothetical protein
MSTFETEDEFEEDWYENAADEYEAEAAEQERILDEAGLSNADEVEQQKYLEDFYAKQREKNSLLMNGSRTVNAGRRNTTNRGRVVQILIGINETQPVEEYMINFFIGGSFVDEYLKKTLFVESVRVVA